VITVQPVGAEAAAALAEIHRLGFEPAWTAKELAVLCETPGAFALIASNQHGPAGFVLCRVAADEAEVLTIATLPEFRRRGVGSALLDQALIVAGQRGARSVFLEVALDNAGALALYAARGFREVGRRPRYYARVGGDVAALIMKRDLNR
jgi:ribosomal-protein-alanine N-acetyltransferase